MPAGIYDLAIDVFRKIPWEGLFSKFRAQSKRLAILVQKGDELDHFGLYQDAITVYMKAYGSKPQSSLLLLKLANSHWKLRNFEQAETLLKDAKLYADSSAARYGVCQLEVQLLFTQAECKPSVALFEECLKVLNLALQEKPDCCLSTGRKALVSLEALKSMPSLGEAETIRYHKLAQHSFLQCLALNKPGSLTQQKHLKQTLMELTDYEAQTKLHSFWETKIEEGHRILEKGRTQPLKIRRGRKLFTVLFMGLIMLSVSGIGVLDNLDLG